MCSLTPPSCISLGEISSSLSNTNCSALECDLCSKITLLNLKKSRLEAQVTFNKTQTMLAEMELHLIEAELRHELQKQESKPHVRPPAKVHTMNRKRVWVRIPLRQRVCHSLRTTKRCTTLNDGENPDDGNDYGNGQDTYENDPDDCQSHHKQVSKLVEVITNGGRSKKRKLSSDDAQDTEVSSDADQCQLNSTPLAVEEIENSSDADQGQVNSTSGSSPMAVEEMENREQTRDAALEADARADINAEHAGGSETTTNSRNKETKKNNYDELETNAEKLSDRKHRTEEKTINNDKLEINTEKSCSTNHRSEKESVNNGEQQTYNERLKSRIYRSDKESVSNDEHEADTERSNSRNYRSEKQYVIYETNNGGPNSRYYRSEKRTANNGEYEMHTKKHRRVNNTINYDDHEIISKKSRSRNYRSEKSVYTIQKNNCRTENRNHNFLTCHNTRSADIVNSSPMAWNQTNRSTSLEINKNVHKQGRVGAVDTNIKINKARITQTSSEYKKSYNHTEKENNCDKFRELQHARGMSYRNKMIRLASSASFVYNRRNMFSKNCKRFL